MSSFEVWIESASKQYLLSKELSEKLSQKDSIEKPFESKYKAKLIIEELLEQLKQFSDCYKENENEINPCFLLELLFNYELGSIDCDTEDNPSAQKHFEICQNLLNDNKFENNDRLQLSLTLFKVLVNNQLGYIWCSRSHFEKASHYLKEAESAYLYWNKSEHNLKPLLLDFMDVFAIEPLSDAKVIERTNDESNKGVKNLERAHTLTLYFLAQTYEKMGENSKSAIYCHSTLKRQYNCIESDDKLFDCIDWSLNAATLSQYFAINSDFNAARHHICCAKKVIKTYPDFESEKFKKGSADLNRIEVKYCLMLLESSAIALKENESIEPSDYNFRPYLLDSPEVEELEKTLSTFPVTNLDEAKKVFKFAINSLNEAKKYYTLNDRASDYIECIQDQSKLYQYLIPFDADYERQCKMHKRRIDLLEDLLKEISPQHFMGQCRQLMFELAEIYSQMVELKIITMNDKKEEQQIQAAKKINLLILKAISHFNSFIKTFHEKSTDSLPQTLPDDYVRPILLCHFSIGRLLSKIITIDPREQMKNWTQCEAYYIKVRDYLNSNPQHKNQFEEELPLLEEMLKLIPGKLQMIMSSTLF